MKHFSPLIPPLFLLVLMISSCADDAGTAANQPYDESDIRAKVYSELYTVLKLDTIGYHIMAIGQGDSLQSGFFWPREYTRHQQGVYSALSGMLPVRVVGMDEIDPPGGTMSNTPYVTVDTHEPVIPAFTKTIERMDGTHLVVVCGVYCPLHLSGYAACNLAFEAGGWQVQSLDFYYLRGWQ